MNQVQEITLKLAEALLGCPEYARYQEARSRILKYPALKRDADMFRKRNYELQCSHADVFEEADHLRREYTQMMQEPLVYEYLDAESAFCRVMQQVNWRIMENLNLDVDFA